MGRVLVIGDIHGSNRALLQVLDRAKVSSDDKLIFIGDYTDGWSESFEVIKTLETLRSQSEFIMGNHDEWVLNHLIKTKNNNHLIDRAWISNGGESTMISFEENGYREDVSILNSLLDFFSNLKPYHIDYNNLFVHAGFLDDRGADHDVVSNLLWSREMWNDAVWAKKWNYVQDERLSLYNNIFIGHTPTINLGHDFPLNVFNIWNLDTGAGWNGKLSIMDVLTKDYWQSDVVMDLHPNENGRGGFKIR